jgi:hypothetical protein
LRDDRRTSTNKELALDIAQIALSETGDAKITLME